MNRPTFLSAPARRLARAAPLATGLGRRIRPVAVLAAVAAALLAPQAGTAPAYAQTDTNCGLAIATTQVGSSTMLFLQIILPGPGTPTGTATFSEGTTQLGTVPVSGIIASLNHTFPAAGSYQVAATYNGDANFSGCMDTETATVTPATTSTKVTSSPNPSTSGRR